MTEDKHTQWDKRDRNPYTQMGAELITKSIALREVNMNRFEAVNQILTLRVSGLLKYQANNPEKVQIDGDEDGGDFLRRYKK